MLNAIIRFALSHRLLVTGLAAALLIYGSWVLRHLPVDVFPNLTKPTVTIMTEGHGRAPEEMEILVTIPLENTLKGLPGLDRIRSVSSAGLSIVYLEFSWDSDLYMSRQLVAERLQLAREQIPEDAQPIMGPVSSLMGQIQQIALYSKEGMLSPIEIRTWADWTIRPRLMALPGVAQITSIGGGLKQYQIMISAEKINQFQITVDQLDKALSKISQNTSGGFIDKGSEELLVRNMGAVSSVEDIEQTVVGLHFGKPVLVKDIATVQIGSQQKRGDGSYMGTPSVVLSVQKQPGADTVEVTRSIEAALKELEGSLPQDLSINTNVFKQSNFIEAAIEGVSSKLRHGSLLVLVVLLIFLANLRMSLITLMAIPLSFFTTFIVFKLFGLSVNTMTLGGLAIAIGELVDDSIVDIENIHRRLRENAKRAHPKSLLEVVYEASSEVRNSIVLATVIIALVFLPLFHLTGLEGRLFAPLAVAYLTALFASLVVSLTLTPALSSFLLKNPKAEKGDTWLVRKLKDLDQTVLSRLLFKPRQVFAVALILLIGALGLLTQMGADFLPKFNEGTAMVSVVAPPGVSLSQSNEIGLQAERTILEIPEVLSVSRRTGRAEQDEHAMGVNVSEIDVDFKKDIKREREEILNDIRQRLAKIPGVGVGVGQPLSHLMDHTLSGVSAQIAIKIFGNDLALLREKAAAVKEALEGIAGLVDLRMEQQGLIPQLKIYVLRDEAAKFGVSTGEITELLESAFRGHVVGQVIEDQKFFDLFFRFDDSSRESIDKVGETIIKTMPDGRKVKVADVADIYESQGPNEISRENGQRRIVVSANASGRDLESLISEIQDRVQKEVDLHKDMRIVYGGQFEAQEEASKTIFLSGILVLLGISVILFSHFQSLLITAQILLTLPFAFIGGVFLLYLTGETLTIASLIGFVTLCGIASRNGIMMISHYIHLVKFEGEKFSKEMIIRGSLERLVPVLMTATVASLALFPLLFAQGEAGAEILHPVAVVIVGGLVTSTLADVMITPVLFFNFGKKTLQKLTKEN